MIFFKKQKQDEILPKPAEIELNVIRVFAQGNEGLRDSAIRIGRKYIHCQYLPEIQFMSEVDTPCPDLGLRSMLRNRILEKNGLGTK